MLSLLPTFEAQPQGAPHLTAVEEEKPDMEFSDPGPETYAFIFIIDRSASMGGIVMQTTC